MSESHHRSAARWTAVASALLTLTLTGCITVAAPAVPPASPAAQPAQTTQPPAVAAVATPSPEPTRDAPSGSTMVLENSAGTVTVTVPSSWTDSTSGTWSDPSALLYHTLEAAPDLEAYHASWDASGVEIRGVDRQTEVPLSSLIEAEVEPYLDACSLGLENAPYSDDIYEGYITTLEDCGGVGTDYIVFAGFPVVGDPATVLVVLQVGGADADRATVIDTVFNSFDALEY